MSYPPAAFHETDAALLRACLAEVNLGILITQSENGPVASHVPFLFEPDAGPQGTLLCHVARANPHGAQVHDGTPALVIFPGADAYISPSWYETKRNDPRVVPTWNYQAIHVRGRTERFDDAAQLRALVTRLTEKHEARAGTGWQVADAPEDYLARMLRGIVGIRITIDAVEGHFKLSQNRSAEDQASVAKALGTSARAEDRALAARMQKHPDS